MQNQCEQCVYFEWDDEFEAYTCVMSMDEDDIQSLTTHRDVCPYFRFGDEYQIVKKQI